MKQILFQEKGDTLFVFKDGKKIVYELNRRPQKVDAKFLALKDWQGFTFADGCKIFRGGKYLFARNILLPNGERAERYACLFDKLYI